MNKNPRRNDPAYKQFYGREYSLRKTRKPTNTKPNNAQQMMINPDGTASRAKVTEDQKRAREARANIESRVADAMLSEEIGEVWS